MIARQRFDLAFRDRIHGPSRCSRAMAQRQQQQATRPQQRDDLAKSPGALDLRQMHPDRVEQDEIEAETQAMHGGELGQPVADPPQGRMPHGALPKPAGRRLGRDGLVTKRRQPRGVPAGSGPDVER